MTPKTLRRSDTVVTRQIILALVLVTLAVIIWRVADVLMIGFGGIVLAALLRGLAMPLAAKFGIRVRWAVLLVVAVLGVLACAMTWSFGQLVTREVTELGQQLPAAMQKLQATLERTDTGRALVLSIRQSTGDSKMLSSIGGAATVFVGGLVDFILILFLSIYFAVDSRMYRDCAVRLLPPRWHVRVRLAMDDAGDALQRWLLGQALAMITVGFLIGIGLAIVGVPLAFALGVLAAIFEFVPVLGPILFSIPGLLLAFTKGPETMLYAFIVYLVVQQFEGNILIPLLQRWVVKLPPVVGLLAIFGGGALLGVTGIIFATPLAVVAMRLVKHLYVEDTLENGVLSPSTRAAAK